MAQLHKRFTDSQVKDLIERYLNKEIERKYLQEIIVYCQINFDMFCHAGEGRYLSEWTPAFAGMTEYGNAYKYCLAVQ